MSWRDQYWTDHINIKGIGQYDFYDLMYDAPVIFKRIYRQSIEAIDQYGFDPERVWARDKELAIITATQRSVFGGQNATPRANRYDYERLKVINDLMWAGIQSSDTVEVVFWQDNFDMLISYTKRTKCLAVMQLLDVQYDELREAGFGIDLLSKISTALHEWAEKLLNPDVSDFYRGHHKKTALEIDNSEDIASNLLSMFYIDDDTEVQADNDEYATDTADAGCT